MRDESLRVAAEQRVPVEFFARDVDDVARDLLGRWLVRDEVVLRIAETEAYGGPEDSASHGRMGRTRRNAPMWGPPGHAYVYLCYGLHQMLNVVAREEGRCGAVLVRACEPVYGLGRIRARRGGRTGAELLNGPGKVGAALDVDVSWSGHPLYLSGGLTLRVGEPVGEHRVGPRVGIGFAAPVDREAPRRYALVDSLWVSRPGVLSTVTEAGGGSVWRDSSNG